MTRLRSRLAIAALLALGLSGSGLLLQAQLLQEVGTWAAAGVGNARSNAATVVLSDGRTLIAGGRLADGTETDSVVIYDPVSGSTTSAGQLLIPRVGAAAAMLNDTSVVIIGGSMGDALTADVELLNLATGTSMLVGAMAEPRVNSAAARLPSGRVLIVGGSTVGDAALATAEIFDPTTYGVAPAGLLTTPRIGASATTLIDGRVLIAGGRTAATTTELRSAEIYDSVAPSAFSVLPTQMSAGRAGHTAVLLPHNAGVLIAGGTSSDSPVASSDLFLPAIFPDPFSYGVGSFTATGAMSAARANAVSGPAGHDGYAFATGGGSTAREFYRYATIKTDKDDYAPGERALITGSGWQPNEEVHLLFQEDPAVHDDYELTVVADGAGNIRWDRWAPEQHDLNVRFYLMAQGAISRAQMTFTDSNPNSVSVTIPQNPNPVTAGGSATFTIQVGYAGNAQPCTVSLGAAPLTAGFPAWPAPPVGGFFSFAPATVRATGGETRTSVLTINTPAGMAGNTYRFRITASHAPISGDTCNGSGAVADVDLVVASASAPPVITEGASVTVNMTEDSTPTAFSLTLHATDPNGDTLSWSISTPAGRGTASATGTGLSKVVSYTPHPNYNGIDVFEVQVSDGTLTDTITVNVNIAAINDEPSFVGSNRTVNEDAGPQSISSWATFDPGGESDEDTQTATYTVSGVSNPGLFSASPAVAPDGTLSFTSAANASGSSTFNVTVQDSGGTLSGGDNTSPTLTYSITVNPVNDAPTFTALNPPTVNEDSGAHTVTPWASFSPGGGADESSQTAIGYTVSNVGNPALFTAGPAVSPSGALTYTLAANAFGTSTFEVTVQDNGGTANGGIDVSAVQSFTITVNAVNDKPSFTASNQTVNEDAGAQTIAAWAAFNPGAANEAGQTATYSVTSISNPGLFVSGALPSVSSNGTLTFTTYPDTSGSSTFNVSVKDDGGTANGGVDTSDTLTFTITVNPVNDAPSFTSGGAVTVNEDSGAYSATWATAISAGPNESGQTVTFNVSNDNNALFSVQPTIASGGALSFTPAADAFGTAQVTVTLSDNGGTANAGIDTSAPVTFTLTVTSVNDEPTFTSGGAVTVNEDSAAYSAAWATAISAGPNEGGQTLTFHVSNDNNALFSVQPAIASNGALTFTLAANANGSSTLTVYLQDDGGIANGGDDTSPTQQFTITVNPVNDAPDFTAANPPTVNEDATAQSITAWANFSPGGGADEASQTATYTVNVTSNPGLFAIAPAVSSSGTLTYTLAADANGTATFEVTVKDNGGTADGGVDTSATKPFTLIVNAVNDEPSFDGSNRTVNEDAGLQTVSSWATFHPGGGADEATQTAAYTVSNVSNAALFSAQPAVAPDGTLTFTTALNASGSSTFDVVVKDSGGTANGGDDTSITKTFTITVNPVNDAPSFTAANPPTVNEDAPAQSFSWVTSSSPGGGADEAGQTLAYTVSAVSNPGVFAIGPAVSPAGVLTYTLAPNANGTTTFKVKVQDNGGTAYGGIDTSADQEFTLVVNAVNDEPSFIGSNQTVAEDAGAQSVASWASFNPGGGPDEGTQTATYTVGVISNPGLFAVGAGPAVSSNGTLTYTPAANAFGYSTFQVTVQDTGGTLNNGDDTSATLTYTITVTGLNDAPANLSFSAAPASISEGASTSLTGSFTDVEGTDTHTVVINWGDGSTNTTISLGAGVLSIPATAHTYADDNPTNTAFDVYTITVTVTDSGTTQTPPYPIPVGTTTGVTVTNVTPTLSITSPADGALYPLGTPITLTVPITDPGADTFTCSINWDDPASPAVETSSSSTKNCNKAHSFAQAGVYTIGITVNDDDQPGVTDTKTVMVIVYDPSAGFVTGGGTIWSPLGAFVPDPTLQGKANFGFVSKYQKGAKTPSGQTEFQFHAGNLNFHGDVYQWLVVSGAKAQYKGTGTLNNVPGYGFLLTATDGQLAGPGVTDKFRIKITAPVTGAVVYDNNPGAGDDPDTNPGQNIQTGSIVIHAK